ncbi:class I SAM-dependent methyltransferase [Occallatibacter riparius]|uniref:Methyltransferase domain-containing protein n=1 Tax=Occallatibacter riparius TaxID=1002689 RepID=A0A9J7BLV7_9BACT|nr:class I SAM-dependent methyltransferase [Occallatibacter riparius]UWZ83465.1 methyltransferase domain-containing protein [Occallatibacter riparius]
MIGEILRISAVLLAGGYMMRQVRKPSRWLGRFMANTMNKSHSTLTDWGLTHVEIRDHDTILDIGCGGGRTLNKLAHLAAQGSVYGVDYAQGSLAASRAYNRELVEQSRVQLEQASVSKLPFPADKFDLITAIETQYYWPDLPGDLREVLRVLKPGGKLVIIAESYKSGRFEWMEGPLMRVLLGACRLSPADQRELFANAGYVNVQFSEERNKGWICVVGTKPIQ